LSLKIWAFGRMGKTTRSPLSTANKRASNQRKSGRFVCWPRLSAYGVGVQVAGNEKMLNIDTA